MLETVAQPTVVDDHDLQITLSIGIAFYTHDSVSADSAMYQAKDEGSNRFVMA